MRQSVPPSLPEADSLSVEANAKVISPDRSVAGHLTNTAPAINAPYAWSLGLEGSSIAVAVIDSGMVDKKNTSVKKSVPAVQ